MLEGHSLWKELLRQDVIKAERRKLVLMNRTHDRGLTHFTLQFSPRHVFQEKLAFSLASLCSTVFFFGGVGAHRTGRQLLGMELGWLH